ncbi:hypothetical protein BGX38DRAFT_1166509 [Terfezia claveryi]|nr:hypothetical protein BGX38DRAFT_1166509 [Terfezia claveryi]
MATFSVQKNIRVLRQPQMRRRQLRRRCNCRYVRRVDKEHSSYPAMAISRYLDERDLESPWSPLPLSDQTEDDRSFSRNRELRVAIDSCIMGNSSSDPLSDIVEGLEEVNVGGSSRSTEWIRVSKIEYGSPRFASSNVREAGLVGNNRPPVAEALTPVVRGGKMLQPVPNFVECEVEYTAEAGWIKVAVW